MILNKCLHLFYQWQLKTVVCHQVLKKQGQTKCCWPLNRGKTVVESSLGPPLKMKASAHEISKIPFSGNSHKRLDIKKT